MNSTKAIKTLNEHEIQKGLSERGSWHDQYRDSPYVFIGNLSLDLTEGDIQTVFAQYGDIAEVNLVRDKKTGMSRGFAFLSYTDQRSTILAVDNFNGIKLTGRIIRVDHVLKYTSPEELEAENAKKKGRHKYSDLVTEELFKSATGDLMFRPVETDALPSQPDLEEANSVSDENIQGKRQRTPREVELRKKFKLGQISEKDYMEEKRRLKKSIRQEAKRDL